MYHLRSTVWTVDDKTPSNDTLLSLTVLKANFPRRLKETGKYRHQLPLMIRSLYHQAEQLQCLKIQNQDHILIYPSPNKLSFQIINQSIWLVILCSKDDMCVFAKHHLNLGTILMSYNFEHVFVFYESTLWLKYFFSRKNHHPHTPPPHIPI